MTKHRRRPPLLSALLLCLAFSADAQEKVLNLYSARHYQTDEALYANFTKQTGIKINRKEAKEDELLEIIRNEGADSPADIFITVDAARLAKADAMGLFAPIKSRLLEERLPANLRSADWFAFSTRARAIVINKDLVKAEDVQNYEDLANPRLKGKVCSRSGAHPYNISLMAALIVFFESAFDVSWKSKTLHPWSVFISSRSNVLAQVENGAATREANRNVVAACE
jgi:iron(III) transport system substrate-binding protein